MTFARRASFDLAPNPIARQLEARRARGLATLDLSESNPTRCGLATPAALRDALLAVANDPASARYEPEPRGALAAREAIARYHARRGASVGPEQVVLSAGTSEGYAHLFRLLGDPGDVVHVPSPGYPLFEQLAALEGLEAVPYPLEPPAHGARWRVGLDALAADLGPRSRAVLVIDPHNPTGSFVDPADWRLLRSMARESGLALVSDEVFADSAAAGAPPPGALTGADDGPLHFVLSGASKVLALPQWKLAWIVAAGPRAPRDEALARLEFVADAYLSVSPLLAQALPALLARREELQAPVLARVAENRGLARHALAGSAAEALAAEAGWSLIVRAHGAHDEESLALALLERHGVLIQPGFFFDLEPRDLEGCPCAHFVVSLLLPTHDLTRGLAALRSELTRAG